MPRSNRSWVARLNADEQRALKVSEEFFQRPDGRVQKLLGRIGRPLDRLLKASPKGLQRGVTNTLQGVLSTVAEGAEGGSYTTALVDELCAKSGLELRPFDRIFDLELPILESTAQARLRTAKRLATVQGGATGLAGAPGLIADIPSLYFLMFRTLHQIAICFGHPVDCASERMYLFEVVHVGHHLELRDRRCALLELDEIEAQSHQASASEDFQRTLLAKAVQQLARKLASSLIQRKAAQSVALLGGAVGAAINRQLMEDVGLTAFHAYRRRFLKSAAERRPAP